MHLTVIGATSTTGSLVLDRALAAGHHVTALTRDRSRVPQRHERLTVLEGDATAVEDCLRAVTGADAVIVTLGAGRRGEVRAAGTRAVVEAMGRAGVSRLVCQTTIGVGSSRGNLNFWWRRVMFGGLLRQAYADHVRQEEIVRDSALDWTIVRPSAFTNEPVEGVRHGFDADAQGLRLKVSRADVAAFLLAQAQDPGYLHRAVSLSA